MPARIPVRFTGSKSVQVVTNNNGEATFEGPAGHYIVEVLPGCTEEVIVTFGGRGTAGLRAGQLTKGQLRAEWRHRVGPGNGAYPSKLPYWPIGETIKLDYDVIDRCVEDKARNAAFSTFSISTGSNVETVETPQMKSDDRALATVLLRCIASGPVSVIVKDSYNPTDQVDLASYIFFAASGGDDRIRCGQAS